MAEGTMGKTFSEKRHQAGCCETTASISRYNFSLFLQKLLFNSSRICPTPTAKIATMRLLVPISTVRKACVTDYMHVYARQRMAASRKSLSTAEVAEYADVHKD